MPSSLNAQKQPMTSDGNALQLNGNLGYIATAAKGDVKINEFLALNIADTVDEAGQHEDWIELYNTTGSPQNLYGLYLTDLFSNPTKYAFPPNTIIQPYGLLVLFLDQDSSTSKYLHCNFKLSGSGEMLMLSDGNGVVSDSITFGVQTTDVSIGRCPNGIGMLSATSKTTFNASNCGVIGIKTTQPVLRYLMVPNPTRNAITISGDAIRLVQIYTVFGELVLEQKSINSENITCTNLSLPNGMYFVKINETVIMRLLVVH